MLNLMRAFSLIERISELCALELEGRSHVQFLLPRLLSHFHISVRTAVWGEPFLFGTEQEFPVSPELSPLCPFWDRGYSPCYDGLALTAYQHTPSKT